MALDNNNGTRKPHTRQKDFEEQKKALEDRIVNDKDMASKIYQRAMETEAYSAEENGAREVRDAEEQQARERADQREQADRQEHAGARRPHSAQARAERQTGRGADSAEAEYENEERHNAAGHARNANGNADARADRQPENAGNGRRQNAQASDADDARTRSGQGRTAQNGAEQDGGTAGNAPRSRRFNTYEMEDPMRRSVRQMNSAGDSDEELKRQRQAQLAGKKHRKRNILIFCIVELFTLIVIFGAGIVLRYANMSQQIEVDKKQLDNSNLEISKKQAMEGSWTVAVFGVDSRDGSVGKGANADVQIIVNVDMGTGAVKMVSVYRDTYLNVSKGNSYAKVNEAYALGGPEQAIQTLNKNLDLNISDYVTFNWRAVIDGIDLLGGVDDVVIDDQKFLNYVNAYIHQSCLDLNISKENPAAMYVKGTGPQHLNGIQALAYMRQRKLDTDFKRTERQRTIIEKCLEKAKQADLATLLKIIDTVMPQVAFNIDTADMIQMAKGISRYNIVDTVGFPTSLDTQSMGKKGDCVIPVTLASNVKELHNFLYGDVNYDPSDAVKRYSNKIADDSGKYKSGTYNEDSSSSGKKSTSAAKDTIEETTKKGANSNISETTRVDRDGYIIKGMDENGKYIYETDANGDLVKSKETTQSGETSDSTKKTTEATKEGETTDSYGPHQTTEATKENSETTETTKHSGTLNPTTETTKHSAEPVVPSETTARPTETHSSSGSSSGKPSTVTPETTAEHTVPAPTAAATTASPEPAGPGANSGPGDPVAVAPGE